MAIDTTTDDPLLRTGDAAALLGVSRQHVVNLCNQGELPCESVGTHRRLRRSDVLAYARRGTTLTRDQARSLWLHHAVAGKLVANPGRSLTIARRNLRNLFVHHPRDRSRRWLVEWAKVLDGSLDELLVVLTSKSQRSVELRQNSPFAGVLTDAERSRVLASFVDHWSTSREA